MGNRVGRGVSVRRPTRPGHSDYLRGAVDRVHEDQAFLVGDAAGLATRDMGEGIWPAIRSGRCAVRSILEDEPYRLDDVTGTSVGHGIPGRLLDWSLTRRVGRDARLAS